MLVVDSALLNDLARDVRTLLESKKTSSKNGSEMNTECVKCFGAAVISQNIIPLCQDEDCFDQVRQLVCEFTKNMIDSFKKGDVGEVQYVQPLSYALFRSISDIVLSNYTRDIKLENKKTNIVDTQYRTILRTPQGKYINVSGETDITMLYCGIPIETWEDKVLNMEDVTSPTTIGQPLAEVGGMGEKFKDMVGAQAPTFCGVLTTGLLWTMSFRIYSNGQILYKRTNPINACSWIENVPTPDDDGINIITSLLLTSLRKAEELIQIIDQRNKVIFSRWSHCPDKDGWSEENDEDSDDSGGGNRGDGGGDRDSVIKSVSNDLSKMTTRSTTKTRGEAKNGNSHGKRTPLSPINMNSIISIDNLAKHNSLLQQKSVLSILNH